MIDVKDNDSSREVYVIKASHSVICRKTTSSFFDSFLAFQCKLRRLKSSLTLLLLRVCIEDGGAVSTIELRPSCSASFAISLINAFSACQTNSIIMGLVFYIDSRSCNYEKR